jgi:hypothetical protein
MNVELDPLVTTVDTFLDGLDVPLNQAKSLAAKTDIDFINEAGSFDPKLKVANGKAIGEAITEYNQTVKGRRVAGAALQAGLDPVIAVSLAYEAGRSVALPDWHYAEPGSQYAKPIPDMPDLAGDVRSRLFNTVAKVQEAVGWWSSAEPYFLKYETTDHGIAATVLPSHGSGNVIAETNDSTSGWDTSPGSIYSKFEGGTRVVITGKDDEVQWIEVRDKPDDFTWPILGYHDFHAKPEDFTGKNYDRFAFVGERTSDPNERTNSQRFAARIALGMFIANAGGDQPAVQLPAPSDEFSQAIVNLLAKSTMEAFLPPRMKSSVRHGGGRMTGYEVEGVTTHEVNNLVKSSTEQELRTYLQAVGAGIVDLSDTTDALLAKRYESRLLAGRIDVIKARSNIETFFSSLA